MTDRGTQTYRADEIWDLLKEITDPEIPILNIVEMGIVRDVMIESGYVKIKITPTYSGCPAMSAIEQLISLKLAAEEIRNFDVEVVFEEAWTTEWMTEEAKQKLKEYGIAPPHSPDKEEDIFGAASEKNIKCPYCDSSQTALQSEFGSTACKSQYFCKHCEQPFEYFKCH